MKGMNDEERQAYYCGLDIGIHDKQRKIYNCVIPSGIESKTEREFYLKGYNEANKKGETENECRGTD